jgi:hypothetical protein
MHNAEQKCLLNCCCNFRLIIILFLIQTPLNGSYFSRILGAFANLWTAVYVRLSARNILAPNENIFIKFHIRLFLKIMLIKFKFHWNRTRIPGSLRDDKSKFLTISGSALFRMKNVLDRNFSENQKYFMMNNSLCKSCHLWQCGKYSRVR